MKKLILAVLLLHLSTPLFAGNIADALANSSVPVEIMVYGSVDIIEQAFTMTSLILSDNQMTNVVYLAAFLGVVLSLTTSMASMAISDKTAAVKVSLGKTFIFMLVYWSFFAPVRTVEIHDLQQNRQASVGGVPWIIAFTVGTLTQLESQVIDLLDTAYIGAPDHYKRGGGGVGFTILENITARKFVMPDPALMTNLSSYVDKCVLFELGRPGSSLKASALQTNENVMDVIDEAASPSVTVSWMDFLTEARSTITCQTAWTRISAVLSNNTTWLRPMNAVCSKAGLKTSDAQGQAQCQGLIAEYSKLGLGADMTSSPSAQHYMMQSTVNNAIADVIREGGDNSVLHSANQGLMNKGISSGILVNEWMPIARAMMLGLAVIMTPFIVVLIPTPKGAEAVNTMFGFYVFLMVWGIIDASIHYYIVKIAEVLFAEASAYKLGLPSIVLTPSSTAKAVSMYGGLRTMGVGLAGVFSKMLAGQTASLLASSAGQLAGQAKAAGESASTLITNDGAGSKTKSMMQGESVMTMANVSPYSYRDQTRGMFGENMQKATRGAVQYENMANATRANQFNERTSIGTANKIEDRLGPDAVDKKTTADSYAQARGAETNLEKEKFLSTTEGAKKDAISDRGYKEDMNLTGKDAEWTADRRAKDAGVNAHFDHGSTKGKVQQAVATGQKLDQYAQMQSGQLDSKMAAGLNSKGFGMARTGDAWSGKANNMKMSRAIDQKNLEQTKKDLKGRASQEFIDNLQAGDTLEGSGLNTGADSGHFSIKRGNQRIDEDTVASKTNHTNSVDVGDKRSSHTQKALMQDAVKGDKKAQETVGDYYTTDDGELDTNNSREMTKQITQDINTFIDENFKTDASGKMSGNISAMVSSPGFVKFVSGLNLGAKIDWNEAAGMSRDQRSNMIAGLVESTTRDNFDEAKKETAQWKESIGAENVTKEQEMQRLNQVMGKKQSEDTLGFSEGYAKAGMANKDATAGAMDTIAKGAGKIADKLPDAAQAVLDHNNPMKNREKAFEYSKELNEQNTPSTPKSSGGG